MLNGAGIHQNFGWKPVLKHADAIPAWNFDVDISMLDLTAVHMFMVKILSAANNVIMLAFNSDAGNVYDYTNHRHGRNAGAAINAHNQASNAVNYNGLYSHINGRINLYLQITAAGLQVDHKGFGWKDTNNFSVVEGSALYKGGAPYTEFNLDGNMVNFTYELQVFKSVFSF